MRILSLLVCNLVAQEVFIMILESYIVLSKTLRTAGAFPKDLKKETQVSPRNLLDQQSLSFITFS